MEIEEKIQKRINEYWSLSNSLDVKATIRHAKIKEEFEPLDKRQYLEPITNYMGIEVYQKGKSVYVLNTKSKVVTKLHFRYFKERNVNKVKAEVIGVVANGLMYHTRIRKTGDKFATKSKKAAQKLSKLLYKNGEFLPFKLKGDKLL